MMEGKVKVAKCERILEKTSPDGHSTRTPLAAKQADIANILACSPYKEISTSSFFGSGGALSKSPRQGK